MHKRKNVCSGVAAVWLIVGLLVSEVDPAFAGGADVRNRAMELNLCEVDEEQCDAGTLCYINPCVENQCPDEFAFCEEAVGAFTGQLIISVDDQPPIASDPPPACGAEGGTTSATVTLLARKADGSTFVASGVYSETTSPNPCEVPNCVNDGRTFFCTTTEGLTRLTETNLVDPSAPLDASWLLLQRFPGDISAAILEHFPGIQGEPFPVRVAPTSVSDHSGPGDTRPTEARFCIKGHIVP